MSEPETFSSTHTRFAQQLLLDVQSVLSRLAAQIRSEMFRNSMGEQGVWGTQNPEEILPFIDSDYWAIMAAVQYARWIHGWLLAEINRHAGLCDNRKDLDVNPPEMPDRLMWATPRLGQVAEWLTHAIFGAQCSGSETVRTMAGYIAMLLDWATPTLMPLAPPPAPMERW